MNTFLRHRALPTFGASIIRAWGRSVRAELVDEGEIFSLRKRPAVIFAFWHNQLLLAPYFYRLYEQKRQAVAMTSRSNDGQWLTDILREFRIEAARGSTSKAGSSAARVVARLVQRENYDVAITPDGPRGPRYTIHPGVFYLSQLTGSPIVPLRMEYGRQTSLRSWDRFQIPWPMTSCRVIFGHPIPVPVLATATQLAEIQTRLQKGLGAGPATS